MGVKATESVTSKSMWMSSDVSQLGEKGNNIKKMTNSTLNENFSSSIFISLVCLT